MKNIKISFYFLFFVISSLFYLTSCGLDTYIVVDGPNSINHSPSYTTEDFSNEYFEFNTNDVNQSNYPSDFKYLGTQVYYKIYGSYSTMLSEISYLETLAESENSAQAPGKMMNPVSSGGYGYQALVTNNSTSNVLIPVDENKPYRSVYIRLTDYQNAPEFSARILVDGQYLNGSASNSIPVRYEDDLSFNFGRDASNDKIPVPYNSSTGEGDLDTKASSVPSDGVWYVAMFAVALGRDVTYTMQYSNILFLGSVAISSNTPDN